MLIQMDIRFETMYYISIESKNDYQFIDRFMEGLVIWLSLRTITITRDMSPSCNLSFPSYCNQRHLSLRFERLSIQLLPSYLHVYREFFRTLRFLISGFRQKRTLAKFYFIFELGFISPLRSNNEIIFTHVIYK